MKRVLPVIGALAVGAVVIVSRIGHDGPEVRTGWAAVSHWMDGVTVGFEGFHLPESGAPTIADLRQSSSIGYETGQGADDSARALSRESDMDFETTHTLYCEFLAGYLDSGGEQTVSEWLEERLQTPPEQVESARYRLEEVAESTASIGEKAYETASATVCLF